MELKKLLPNYLVDDILFSSLWDAATYMQMSDKNRWTISRVDVHVMSGHPVSVDTSFIDDTQEVEA